MHATRPERLAVTVRTVLLVVFGLGVAAPAFAAETKTEGSTASKAVVRPDYLDAMIRAAWEENSIKPSAMATDAEFMRRLYLDLLGRIPTVQESLAFLENKEKGKRAKLVEYLLEHPDYAKNLGNIWTVLLVGRKQAARQVDKAALSSWLRRQFAENRPWNETAYDLITATGSNKENGAVNYTMAHLDSGAVPITSITARVFLGKQIQCTQCHDHPSNDWKQRDFWGINAFFKGVKFEEVMKTDATGAEVTDYYKLMDRPTDAYSTFEKRNAYMEIAFPTFLDGRKISQGKDVDRRKELGKFITAADNDQFSRAFVNRMWGHFMGRGIVHPVDDFGVHNPASHPELLDKLGADFQAGGYDVKTLIRWITNSEAYQLSSTKTKSNELDETLFSHMVLKPMTPEQLFDSLLTSTDAHKTSADMDKKRDTWLRQFIVTFGNDEQGETTNFQGTIPQALMMMNGDLMTSATGGKTGSFLAKLLDEARKRSRSHPVPFIINRLYLAALSRPPTATEMANARKIIASSPDTINLIEDMFWALLNSNEFVLNR